MKKIIKYSQELYYVVSAVVQVTTSFRVGGTQSTILLDNFFLLIT